MKTVFVVEDDQAIGEVFGQALSREPSSLPVLATDGEEALAVVQDIRPDLVVLDDQLPGMTGSELYDHLHTMRALRAVPTILISTRLPERELQ